MRCRIAAKRKSVKLQEVGARSKTGSLVWLGFDLSGHKNRTARRLSDADLQHVAWLSRLRKLFFFATGALKGLSGHRSPSEKDNLHKRINTLQAPLRTRSP